MAITLEYIHQLCMEGESSHLDYKSEQYPFVGVTDPEKAELLKDILSMANAFGTQTRYILIGITQQSDGSGKVTGIAKNQFIDDASIQQFINGKLNRSIEFQSYSVPIDDKKIIQVIEIPAQKERPYYSSKQTGAMKSNTVEIRIGSSSRPATPDEIARMGKETQIQQNRRDIDISLDIPGNEIGDIDFRTVHISLEGDLPIELDHTPYDYTKPFKPIPFLKKFTYIRDIFQTIRVDIGLKNESNLSVEQIQIEAFISQCSYQCVKMIEDFPERPSELCFPRSALRDNIGAKILHPGQSDPVFESLYFKVMRNGDFTLDITVLGKDIQPVNKQFHIKVQSIPYSIKVKEVEIFFDCFDTEDKYWDFRELMLKGKENVNA